MAKKAKSDTYDKRIMDLVATEPSTEFANYVPTVVTPDMIVGKTIKKGKVPRYCKKELLAILGTAETLPAAPYENEEFEMWGVAVCRTYPACKRMDVAFEMHTEGYWKDKNVFARLRDDPAPIYMHKKVSGIPNSIRYPIETITENYGKYFTNSIAYMLALALHSYNVTGKPKHVALFGVHMAAKEEYTDQRPCCEYWIGMMRGAGMDVTPSPGGAILQSNGMYGYENYHPVCYEFRQRISALQRGYQQARSEWERWRIQMAKNEGGITENEHWLRRFQTDDIPK